MGDKAHWLCLVLPWCPDCLSHRGSTSPVPCFLLGVYRRRVLSAQTGTVTSAFHEPCFTSKDYYKTSVCDANDFHEWDYEKPVKHACICACALLSHLTLYKSLSYSQVMRHENSSILELDGKEVSEFTPSKPREKWLRKRTHVKIRVSSFSPFPYQNYITCTYCVPTLINWCYQVKLL